MTEEPREIVESALAEIRDIFADIHMVRRKLNELRDHFKRQLQDGTITWFRYDVEIHDLSRMQRTLDAQWLRLQQQRSRALEKLRHLA
ncbi:MAG: hypothetical protein ABIV43_03905 [Candidatus Saccharimonadales bacterium]